MNTIRLSLQINTNEQKSINFFKKFSIISKLKVAFLKNDCFINFFFKLNFISLLFIIYIINL